MPDASQSNEQGLVDQIKKRDERKSENIDQEREADMWSLTPHHSIAQTVDPYCIPL